MRWLSSIFLTTALWTLVCSLYVLTNLPTAAHHPRPGWRMLTLLLLAWAASLFLFIGALGQLFRHAHIWKIVIPPSALLLVVGSATSARVLTAAHPLERTNAFLLLLIVPTTLAAASLWGGLYSKHSAN